MSRKHRGKGEESNGVTDIWKNIWKLNIPGVVKMFVWKALNNCLPTKWNLACRKVVRDYFCPICKLQKETVTHALCSYGGAMDVWADKASPVQKWVSTERDMQELWADWCEKLQEEELELMAVVLRRIWQAAASLSEFQQAQKQNARCQMVGTRQRDLCRWTAPATGQIKANWDATLKLEEGRMGAGVVIRNENGDLMVSVCSQKQNVCNPLVAELQALWCALRICADLNLTEVVFEGDALNIVKVVNNSESNWEWHGQLVEDVKDILRNRPMWKLIHTYRECSRVAHFLAKFSLTVNGEQIWIEEGPAGIQYYVMKDKTVMNTDK
ncbi:uncharacterized protein LOC122274608 [Carya illinoinensis]|uniref:uncharacterized protein LOC122274608 n=1 Tax=Carya illinoinensis TaxID=32201 RepID=UPI001C719545|nr:uncharacterized protein LOC122274608 [Carya illinoinensis]